MATVDERIEPRLARWIGEQPVFFVPTAPLDGEGLVNLSPKGLRGTFGVLDDHTFASFDGTPTVVRLLAGLPSW